jgi:OmpA-OmpF porin, OOP family
VAKEQQIARTKEIVIKKGITEKMSYPTSASVQVTPEMKIYLNKVAEYMLNNPDARIIIIGHSDNQGTIEQRTWRARERAKNVEKYLLKELNIPQDRVIASWKGALFAIATNDTEEGRQQNRRVEITIEE